MTTPTPAPASPRPALGALVAPAALGVILAACGSGSETGDGVTDAADEAMEDVASGADDPVEAAEQATEDVEEMAETMRENLEGQQADQGGGSASLTVGDETWTFERVLCAMGEEEIGQEGAELVLTSIQDGLQFYVSIDSFGHSVTLDDIEDFQNPSVSLHSRSEDFIKVDGKNVSGEMAMVSGEDVMTELEASFEGVCP